jgi:CMP-N,N'-diacetyllegionaminic acid synthase
MTTSLTVLGLVPARGGSKGISRKNVRPLGGRPLLAYTARSALEARRLSRVVLSTDDDEIAEAGRQAGLEVPFRRPPELATDETSMVAVVRHALETLEAAGERYDAVCLLQPTVPFREPAEIDDCIRLLEDSGADAAITVAPVPTSYNPHWVFLAGSEGYLHLSTGETRPIARRQDLPPAYHRDGSVYVARRELVLERETLCGGRLVGHLIQRRLHVNIDGPEDWAAAEIIVGARS